MASIIEELQRREDAAGAEANRLREQIEHLAQELARAEERASRLAIAREEFADVLDEVASPDLEAGRAIRHDDQDTAQAPAGSAAARRSGSWRSRPGGRG